jgi:hypothetical protein
MTSTFSSRGFATPRAAWFTNRWSGTAPSLLSRLHGPSNGASIEISRIRPSHALADALQYEYKTIVDTGLVLQIDSPDFVMMRNRQYWNRPWDEYRRSIELRVEALNYALSLVPEDRICFHVCSGNFEGPHENEVPLKDVVDLVLKVKAQA